MIPSDLVDLTEEDSDQMPPASNYIQTSEVVRQEMAAFRCPLTTHVYASSAPSTPQSTPRKRKRDEKSVPSVTSRRPSDSIAHSDVKRPSPPSQAPGRRLSSNFKSEGTRSKRMQGLQESANTGNRNVTSSTAGSEANPIEVTDDEDDLRAAIWHACPVSTSGRSLNHDPDLQILGSRSFRDGTEDEDMNTPSETSDLDLYNRFTNEEFAAEYELPEIIERLSQLEIAQQEEQFNNRKVVSEYKGRGFTCAAGKSVELRDGTFMRILAVEQNGNGKTFIRGHPLARQTHQAPTMPRTHNELVWVERQLRGATELSVEALPSEISIAEVVKNRDVVFTNRRYPMVSSNNDVDTFANLNQDFHCGPLFCRWKLAIFRDARGKVIAESYQHLMYKDADHGKERESRTGEILFPRIADSRSRSQWREYVTRPGGDHVTAQTVHDLEGEGGAEVQEIRKYTFGDAFCGAGGTSRGALDAGLFVKWGFDLDEQAIASYKANFAPSGTNCRHESVHDFLTRVESDALVVVDVLHASPPCQTFSWAKTRRTPEQDEKNEAVLFSIGQLLDKVRPRIVTMEETDGLVSCHRHWFHALIHIFIHKGYSVRWKVLRLEGYGVPQPRKRLVIIAAGPGEELPAFPEPTHGEQSASKKPLVTINDCIGKLRPGAPDHNLDTVHEFSIPKMPFNSSTLAKTLTCHGGQDNYHPNGLRHYTVREFASLQTFPIRHKFTGGHGRTAKKKQIGNAVPPAFACRLLKAVVKSLREDDDKKQRMSEMGLVQ